MKRSCSLRSRGTAPGSALRVLPALGFALMGAFTFASCSGGGSAGGVQGTSGNFVVLRTEPANNGALFLNDPIRIDFSNEVNFNSANLNTIAFQVFDAAGNALTEQPAGTFRMARSPGDNAIGRRLEFVPRFPTNNAYTNGGFRPGRTYLVQLIGGEQRRGNVLVDAAGRSLAQPTSFQFETADGTTPSELFRDTRAGGPRRTGFSVTGGLNNAYLNKGGQTPVEVVLNFDQPLNPSSLNVPVDVNIDPATREQGKQGRIFLQYVDTEFTQPQWIPARVVLVENSLEGAEVRLLPLGVLPNNATVEVIVENTLEDMSGESNTSDASYDRVFATFNTQQALEPQFDAIVETFDTIDRFDLGAPFVEPLAEVNSGFIKANFDFEGSSTILDFQPSSQEVILNTDFTQITPKNGPPINVSGGVFQFRDVTIPAGVTVRATGSNPMVWLVTGDFIVDGALRAEGGEGARVDTLNAANFPTPGGVGNAGSGNGGRGSPNTQGQSLTGEAGFGPGQVPAGGGGGGNIGVRSSCGRGSGGGGGAFGSEGDPYYKQKKDSSSVGFIQQTGVGGYGCSGGSGASSRSLPGGFAGATAFTDVRADNDYWGSAVDLNRQIRIDGELVVPRGGSGGGGGGDLAGSLGGSNFISNNKGGGGGAGGGVIIIKALGKIVIGPTGVISADGGNGGGGEQAGGNNQGGGGGGGSGGMVVLMTGDSIEIDTHGETYAMGDPNTPSAPATPVGSYQFAISADGGLGTQGSFGGVSWSNKYPPPNDGEKWDRNPAGAFGGMGIIQLMAPPGDNTRDGTNTALDDNIKIFTTDASGRTELSGEEKERYIAWRGFPDDSGVWVDDAGAPTYNNDPAAVSSYPNWAVPPASFPSHVEGRDSEGDIRPAPILLPAPFGSKSRVRTQWIDLGQGSVRLPTSQFGATGARRIREDLSTTPPLLAGPRYEFSGTNADPNSGWTGYVDYVQTGTGGVALSFPKVGPAHPISTISPTSSFEGVPAYEVRLASSPLGSIVDRYSQYQAQLLNAAGEVESQHRILSHDSRVLYLSTDQGALPGDLSGLRLQIVAQFFDVRTSGATGLRPTFNNVAGTQTPVANVRFGFAFHRDPAKPQLVLGASGTRTVDLNRFPVDPGTFLYDGDPENPANPVTDPLDLSDPAVQEQIRAEGFRFVQWDILFNTRFSETEANNTRQSSNLGPSSPRPELHFLYLPYRY